MIRSEYIQTEEGMRVEHIKRFVKIIYLKYLIEPKSKNVINKNRQHRVLFRQSTKNQLLRYNRRAHRSKLILEIDFYVSENNPPAIHQLVKNYLDLLHKRDDLDVKTEGLLFNDDSDIYLLMARIHYVAEGEARIEIKSYNFNFFLKDLEIAKKLYLVYKDMQYNKFDSNGIDNFYEQLETHQSIKSFYESTNQLDYYEFELFFLKQRFQQKYLEERSLSARTYLDLLSVYIKDKSESIGIVNSKLRDLLQNSIYIFNSLEIKSYPIKAGDGEIIKKELQEKLSEFKKTYSFLFPLYYPVKVVIIATEPINIHSKVDLDNIARNYILPLLIDVFRPPADFIIPDFVKGNPKYYARIHQIKGIPKYGIVSYEAIKIVENQGDTGKIMVVLDSGYSWNTAWNKINSVINAALDI